MGEKKILIIDDERHMVRLMEYHLNQRGYRVITAFDGREGLEKANSQKPDLVLLDIKMPGMDGYEVCRQIKTFSGTSHIPVIFVSVFGDFEDARLRGANSCVKKPFTPEVLLKEVDQILR